MLFKKIYLKQGKIVDYEINPPFGIFYERNGRNNLEPEVRYGSLVAGEEGFEPSLTGPEPAVLPLDYSPVHLRL
jgi:hypothetical protein